MYKLIEQYSMKQCRLYIPTALYHLMMSIVLVSLQQVESES